MARSSFTTTIEDKIQKDFKIKCVQKDTKMNDVLELFMKSFIEDEITLETKLKTKLK